MTSTPHRSELHCKFGSIWEDILIHAYNLPISYPHANIAIPANDIKSCFCQIKHHPDIVGAFSYVIAEYLFFQVGLAKGANFSPSNWEAVWRIQSALATGLYHDTSLVPKHRTILDRIQWCRSLQPSSVPLLTRALKDAVNPCIRDTNGTLVATPHLLYMNDNMYLNVADIACFTHATAAGIEAIFILLGESNLTHKTQSLGTSCST